MEEWKVGRCASTPPSIGYCSGADEGLPFFYKHGVLYGNSIAVIIHSLDYSLSTHLRDLLSHSLSARLIPAYGFGAVRLPLQPNRCSFVQSQAEAEDV